jgi:hypothetical protein
MKLHLSRRPRSAGRNPRSQEKGVALITVLAIVLLMTVLITSFFTMSRNELTTAIKDSENLKARALADAAVNMAISQIREGTTQLNTDGGFLAWSSQPGAIRVYRNDGQLNRIIKLYSARLMAGDSLSQVQSQDIRNDWDSLPNQWVDMNAPSITPSPTQPDDLDEALIVFPIVDPRAMRGKKEDSVEGFSYERRSVNGVVPASGGKPNSQRLPMPVRWLYLLADGSSGVLNNGGEFDPSDGSAIPTKENPIVGRLGFWADDETCKINLNTASEGVHWDTPRASTEEDRWMGASQPTNGEYQRYPGHPAMVSLSSVLFPNKRFAAANSHSPLPPKGDGVQMREMEEKEIQSIWRMSPYIYGEKKNTMTEASSFGGRQRPTSLAGTTQGTNPSQIKSLKGQPNPKHLYASYDDYVISSLSDAAIDGRPTDIVVRERRAVQQDAEIKLPVDRIQQGRFFLTTRSAAPEITIPGTPRISLWPLAGSEGGQVGVDQELISDRPRIGASSAYSVYDVLIGFNTHLKQGRAIRPYYFQRQDVGSRHAEFYDRFSGRNNTLWRYMSNLMIERIPGFTVRADNRLGTFPSFGDKYGSGALDDINAIAALMIDYIRNTNLTDGNINSAQWYVSSGAWGQVTPICMCGGVSAHNATWSFSTRPLPKGVGRFLTVSEVALAVGLRNKVPAGTEVPNGAFFGDNQATARALGTNFDHYEIEVAVLIEGFSAGHGWGEYRPRAGFTLTGFQGGTKTNERRPNTNSGQTAQEWSIGDMSLSGKRLAFPSNMTNRSTAASDSTTPAGNWVGWGGTLGTRFQNRLIAFKPLLWSLTPGEQIPLFTFSGSPNNPSQNHLRLLITDNGTSPAIDQAVDTGNLIQFIPLAFPEINRGSIALPFNDPEPIPFTDPAATGGPAAGKTTRIARARGTNGELYGPNGLIHPAYDIVQSLVPNHGDFRLIAAKRAVMQGQGRDGENNNAREYPTFVAHPNYGTFRLAHSLTEPQPALNEKIRRATPYTSQPALRRDDGYFDADGQRPSSVRRTDMDFEPAYLPDFPIKPWMEREQVRVVYPLNTANLGAGGISGGKTTMLPMNEVFNNTRYDILSGNRFQRGPGRPDKTGDFDNGVGPAADGPYIGRGDDGDVLAARSNNGWPYFQALDARTRGTGAPAVNSAMFAPNRVVTSAGIFGSLPTGIQANVPWQTLLFRPDLELLRPTGQVDLQEQHYGSRFPRDHLIMDLFWMPVVQPYAISEPFETKGKINMNYQILPFTYIKRATALHALLKAEKLMAIPDERTDDYKVADTQGGPHGQYEMADKSEKAMFRHFIDPDQTLRQWEDRFKDVYPRGTPGSWKPGAFISPTEICDQWLVPQGYAMEDMYNFWNTHRQTGDNTKERPYVNLYPRLTTRSNTFRVHVVAQALRKNLRSDPKTFDTALGDQVMAEYRGSYLIERSIDPNDPDIPDYAQIIRDNPGADFTPLDKYYYYRISQVKQFVR